MCGSMPKPPCACWLPENPAALKAVGTAAAAIVSFCLLPLSGGVRFHVLRIVGFEL